MSLSNNKKLEISTQGGRHFIFVARLKAQLLRTYLQTKGVTSTPPQAVTEDTSSMEIHDSYNLANVQTLLNNWAR
jgi:hypothetical protein